MSNTGDTPPPAASAPHLYQVGQPYIPGHGPWPEAVEYNWRQGAHELRLFLGRLRADEVQDIRGGESEFGLVVDGPIIFLLFRFGRVIPWSDAPFTIHMVPEDQRREPPRLEQNQGMLLTVILVEAETGIVRALRAVSLSPHFSRQLHAAIRRQLQDRFDQVAYDRHLALVNSRAASAELLQHARARTKGGQ